MVSVQIYLSICRATQLCIDTTAVRLQIRLDRQQILYTGYPQTVGLFCNFRQQPGCDSRISIKLYQNSLKVPESSDYILHPPHGAQPHVAAFALPIPRVLECFDINGVSDCRGGAAQQLVIRARHEHSRRFHNLLGLPMLSHLRHYYDTMLNGLQPMLTRHKIIRLGPSL